MRINQPRRERRWPLLLAAALITTALAMGACYLAGSVLSGPALNNIGLPPTDLNAIDVEFGEIKGWFVPAETASTGGALGCVLLMHGVRSDRRSMIERARFLRKSGYSTLLFDFQAHGESPGHHITFGHLESANARAAVSLLRLKFDCSKIAAIGQSLGGAAALLGEGPIEVDALILESVYLTIDDAVADRMSARLGWVGPLLAPLLTIQLQPRLGINRQTLMPINHIGMFDGAVLVMGGTDDLHTPIEDTRRLYDMAKEPKAFWAVPGAGHIDLHKFARSEYQRRLLGFLTEHLASPGLTAQ